MKNREHVVTIDIALHAKQRVKPNPAFAHAKALNLSAVTLGELSACTADFPIAFVRHPQTLVIRPVAMFGLRPEENVYYNEEGWDSTYVPLLIQRHPFLIGADDKDPNTTMLTMCLDTTSPFLSESEGIPLFSESGQGTDFLNLANRMLFEIFEGEKLTEQFTKKMVEFDLLAPFELIVQSADGEVRKVTGLWTLSETKLRELSPERVQELHKLDFLPACYLILGSLFQLHNLMGLRNRKNVEQLKYRIELEPQQPAAAQ